MDSIKNFLKEISEGKFKRGLFKFNDSIIEDERYKKTYQWIYEKYVIDGRGFKSIIKDYDLGISYSFLRRFVKYLGFELHSNKNANDFLRKRRSENAKSDYINKTGFFSNGIQESIHHKSESRGIQGYYWNSSMGKYVWLRSSWEFIYAKWLNKHKNIIWDVEVEQYNLSDKTQYRPDFFLFDENGNIKQIVEIKGYWKDKAYKVKLLKEEYSLPIILIDDIKPYCETYINSEILLWKKIRKLE